MDEIAALTPTFARRELRKARRDGLGAMAVQRRRAAGHADDACRPFRAAARASSCSPNMCRPSERTGPRFPLILTTGRILSQYNVGAQTRRTENAALARGGRAGNPSASTPNSAAFSTAISSRCRSRAGDVALAREDHRERMQPGVVYTTFHHPGSGANVVTTDNSDWATNCPEYKVTAVEVRRTNALSTGRSATARKIFRCGVLEAAPMPRMSLSAGRRVAFDEGAKDRRRERPEPAVERAIAEEIPVSFRLRRRALCGDDGQPRRRRGFRLGLQPDRRVVRAADEISGWTSRRRPWLALEIELAPEQLRGHLARRRAMTGRTSCGLCGVESVEQLPQAARVADAAPIAPKAVFAALAISKRASRSMRRPMPCTPPPFARATARIRRPARGRRAPQCARQADRRAAARQGLAARGFIVVTSRASFEMVEKTAIFGATTLVAISAPTSLAIERAEALGPDAGGHRPRRRRDGFRRRAAPIRRTANERRRRHEQRSRSHCADRRVQKN